MNYTMAINKLYHSDYGKSQGEVNPMPLDSSIPRYIPPIENLDGNKSSFTSHHLFRDWKLLTSSRRYNENNAVFGVSVAKSMKYAKNEIILASNKNKFFNAYIPTVIAKCGHIIKQSGLDTVWIFRVSGNKRRVDKLINEVFSIGPSYGNNFKLESSEFSIHDICSVFKTYLNNLDGTIIPAKFYEQALKPLKTREHILQQYLSSLKEENKSNFTVPDQEVNSMIQEYSLLIQKLPKENGPLLIYLLDLLRLVSNNSKVNMMTVHNLAVVFSPSILADAKHLSNIDEHNVTVCVLIFLITYLDKIMDTLI